MNHSELNLEPWELSEDRLAFFRWGQLGDRFLLTNDAGDWMWLAESEFRDLLAGRIGVGHPAFPRLQQTGFVREGLDLDALAARVAKRIRHLVRGLRHHSLCLGGGDSEPRMAEATAERILDFALQSTATDLTIEFYSTNGEALSHFDLMRSLMDASRVLSRQAAGKRIRFRLQTDFSKMNEAAAQWIVSNQVEVCFKFHGPAALHDSIRGVVGGGEYARILYWMEFFARAPALPSGVSSLRLLDARLTTTRQVLVDWRQVIDEYVERGLRTICFQMLPRAAVNREEWERIGYAVPEFEAAYRRALAYLLELNGRGIDIREGTACLILPKVFGVDDAAAVQIQSPCASGTGELAYSPEGRIFPSAEAQLLAWRGDPMFDLGDVREVTISDVARHPTVRAIAAASLLDAQPLCSDCWNKPFCGYSPVRNYIEQGDLHGQRQRCTECREHMLVSRALFEILDRGAEYESALKAWLI